MVSCRFSQHQSANPKKNRSMPQISQVQRLFGRIAPRRSGRQEIPRDVKRVWQETHGGCKIYRKYQEIYGHDIHPIYIIIHWWFEFTTVSWSFILISMDWICRCFEFASVSVWFTTAGKTSLSRRKRMSTRWCPSSLANLVYKSNN